MRTTTIGLLGAALVAGAVPFTGGPATAHADTITGAVDNLRTGWYPHSSALSPAEVAGGNFGQIFNTTVTGSMYAQPVISQGTMLVATSANNIYGLDPVTGVQKWTRNLGTGFNPNDVGCGDILPTVGITSTPVVDPLTNIAYLTSVSYATGTSGAAVYRMHAVSVATGAEQPGFPVAIAGAATNDAHLTFDAKFQLQRPGLLLLNGVVYAGFGSHCDKTPAQGWVAGVSTAGHLTTLWNDEVGAPNGLGGVWAPGGGLVSDGPGAILLATGNGNGAAGPTPGTTPPAQLGQAVVRLQVQADGSLKATDFFSPFDYAKENLCDCDLGSGNPLALPDSFGSVAHPHVLVQVGKSGYIYLLDRDHLGGFQQGPNGSDAVLNRVGPYGGIWGKPSIWTNGVDRYIYETTAAQGGKAGTLKAFKYTFDSKGNPTLSLAAASTDATGASDQYGFSSSSPSLSSNGTAGGSGVLWVVWRSAGQMPQGPATGPSPGELRAYNAVPDGSGKWTPIFRAPIGGATKFMPPVIDGNRVYIGTKDGHVFGFGSPASIALTGTPPPFPVTTVGKSSTLPGVFTATAPVTIKTLTAAGAFTAGTSTPPLPATLAKGATISVPLTFTPTQPGPNDGTLSVTTDTGGNEVLGLSAEGQSATAQLDVAPPALSFGGVAVGSTNTLSAVFSNHGAQPLTIDSVTAPAAPFTSIDAPQAQTAIAPGQSITVNIGFNPTAAGTFGDALTIHSDGGDATVSLTGSAAAAGQLQITPMTIDYGTVAKGASVSKSFTVKNSGQTGLSITKSKPPAAGVGFEATTLMPEGSTTIQPGATLTETVVFTAKSTAPATDTWIINSDAGLGLQTVTFIANGAVAPTGPPSGPPPGPPAGPPSGPPSVAPAVRFLGHLYADVLGRAPDPAGLTFWTGQTQAGLPRTLIAAAYTPSDEYHRQVVTRDYVTFLHRQPDPGGLTFYANLMDHGASDTQLEITLASSREYWIARGNSNSHGYVAAVYADFLQRAPDPGGLTFYANMVHSGVSPSVVATVLANATERDQRIVMNDYEHYLRRDPDPGGLNFYTARLQAGLRNDVIVIDLVGSDEYYLYAQTH